MLLNLLVQSGSVWILCVFWPLAVSSSFYGEKCCRHISKHFVVISFHEVRGRKEGYKGNMSERSKNISTLAYNGFLFLL